MKKATESGVSTKQITVEGGSKWDEESGQVVTSLTIQATITGEAGAQAFKELKDKPMTMILTEAAES